MTIAFLQFLTGVMIIGWIWALYWSYLIGKKSMEPEVPYQPVSNGTQGYGADIGN